MLIYITHNFSTTTATLVIEDSTPVSTKLKLLTPSQQLHPSLTTALIDKFNESPAAAAVSVAVAPGMATLFLNAVIVTSPSAVGAIVKLASIS